MSRVLVVEDNADLAYGLRNNLEIEGHEVDVAGDGEEGLQRALAAGEDAADLILLDLMLPKLDGFRVLRELRDAGVATPVLILTARGEEADIVRGLRLGADDYVTKPFGILELLARVEALLRRTASTAPSEPPRFDTFGDVHIDRAARAVRRADRPVALTPKEFDLLVALLQRDGAVATRIELIREVWGYPGSVVTRTVDTHVAELRRKLEDNPAEPRFILTVPRIGYRLEREPPQG
jgi:DNA-binding response OmpR family regulator